MFIRIATCLGLLAAAWLCGPPGVQAAPSAQPQPQAAYKPALDPRSWRADVAGPRTQVMVLGSVHLSELPAGFQVAHLEPLLTKLAAFAPDIITYEGLSGEECELIQRYPKTYPGVFENYCHELSDAAQAAGVTYAAARAEADATLAAWPAQPSAAQRRRLAAVFMAAGDRPSAVVQWLQLPADQRLPLNGVDERFLPLLGRTTGKYNENYEVAAVLAARLGHQRIFAVDNHTADSIQAGADAGFAAALKQHWKTASDPNDPVLQAYDRFVGNIKSGADMLAFYRFMNEPRTQLVFVETDYRRSLRDTSPQRHGRQYVAWWETRNLRMVANIRSAFGNQIGRAHV